MKALRSLPAVALLAASVVLTGCDSPQKSAAALAGDISEYAANPGPEAQVKVEQGFVRLDKQIAALRSAGRGSEAEIWERERDSLQMKYAAASLSGNLQNVQKAAENIGQAFRQAGQALGEAFRSKPEGE